MLSSPALHNSARYLSSPYILTSSALKAFLFNQPLTIIRTVSTYIYMCIFAVILCSKVLPQTDPRSELVHLSRTNERSLFFLRCQLKKKKCMRICLKNVDRCRYDALAQLRNFGGNLSLLCCRKCKKYPQVKVNFPDAQKRIKVDFQIFL